MAEKPPIVTEAEFLAHVLPDEEQKSAEPAATLEPEDPRQPRTDISAPDGDQTICKVHLTNHKLELLKKRLPDNLLLQELLVLWDALEKPKSILLRIQSAETFQRGFQDYIDAYDATKKIVQTLNNIPKNNWVKEIEELKAALSEIEKEILASDFSALIFAPKFHYWTRNGEIQERDGKKQRNGNFVSVIIEEKMRFYKLPFLLGLDESLDKPLAACDECLLELKNIRSKVKITEDPIKKRKFYGLRLLQAKPYEDAKVKLAEEKQKRALDLLEKEKYQEADLHPEIIDLEREKKIALTENTSFGMAFLDIQPESLEELIRILKNKTKEEIAALRLIMVENRGDDGEREYFGHAAKKGGKPAGLGWPGGGTESDKYSRVPPELAKQTLKDDFLYKIIGHKTREFQNECGHEDLKTFERSFRIQKGKNHVDHFWIMSAHREKNLPVKESHEIVRTVYPTVAELFRIWLKGGDPAYLGSPYFWHLMALVKFFQKYDLLLIDEMKEFLEKAEH